MYRSTREFVGALETAGLLQRIRVPVSPILEITEITDRASKALAGAEPTDAARRFDPRNADFGGKALLFENVEGSKIPVLINQFGSYRRLEIALGCHGDDRFVVDGHTSGGFDGIAERIAHLVQLQPPRSLRDAGRTLRDLAPLLHIGPRRVRNALCQEIIRLNENVDLRILPIIRCWPLDGDFEALGYPAGVNDDIEGVDARGDSINGRGRYITLAGIYTIHPRDRHRPSPVQQNIGMYRVQLLGPRTLAMHWHMH
ncbi:MAG: UbiD family decarboxylase, partial [Phycisphaerales bacterium]|nr:UbiD family decarboxylase [Phycisphaerales bacterium]